MRVPKIYLETSALNFVFTVQAPERRADTLKLFEEIRNGKYVPFTSEYVKEEIDKASTNKMNELYELIAEYNINSLQKTDDITRLAEEYVKEGIIPEKHKMDAFHIATATVNGLDMIISWNFAHIVKRKTIRMTGQVNSRKGYKRIEICSPTEVIEHDV